MLKKPLKEKSIKEACLQLEEALSLFKQEKAAQKKEAFPDEQMEKLKKTLERVKRQLEELS